MIYTAEDLAAQALRANDGDLTRAARWAVEAILEEIGDLGEADLALSLEGVLAILKRLP